MRTALSLKNIKKIDRSDMLSVLLDFPLQCRTALAIAKSASLPPAGQRFNKIVFAGVGGSAIGADLVKSYLYFKSGLPIGVIRDYELPAYVDSSTLVFVSSYSGNTEETLSAYEQAKKKQAVVITVSSGGILKESSLKDKFSFIEIPKGLPPRYALGYLTIIPLYVLSRLGIIDPLETELERAFVILDELKNKNIHPNIPPKDNIAKYHAAKLYNRFPVVYSGSPNFEAVVTRFRSQLNENAKTLASSGFFPEMGHNEIVGWHNPLKLLKGFILVIFRDHQEDPRLTRKIELAKDMLKKEVGVEILEIRPRGEDLLSRIFSLVYIGDFISYYLAITYGIDPAPTQRIDSLKKQV
jgi:glucose/mannose-6-phosphate isomerase